VSPLDPQIIESGFDVIFGLKPRHLVQRAPSSEYIKKSVNLACDTFGGSMDKERRSQNLTRKDLYYSSPIREGFRRLRLPEFLDSGNMKVVKLWAPHNSRHYLLSHEISLGWPWSIARPAGLSQWRIPMTPPEIESATFRLVTQCHNQLHHGVPPAKDHFG